MNRSATMPGVRRWRPACATSSRYLTWASFISARTSSSLGASHAMYPAVACAVEATGRVPLARAQSRRVDVAGRYLDQEYACDQALPRRSLFPSRQDQGARRMGGSQRGVRLEASAAGAVGGGAQQSIGLALKRPSFGYARSEVVDHDH